MLIRPDSRLLKSLVALRGNPNWETVLAHLTAERAAALEKLADSTETVALHRLQGRATLLKEVLDLAATSDQILTKLEAPKRLSDPL